MRTKKKMTNFIELRDVWGNHALNRIQKDKKERLVKGFFNIPLMKKINPKKVVAIVIMTINTPLPTMSLVTNPIIYKKIMGFNTNKFQRKLNILRMKLR